MAKKALKKQSAEELEKKRVDLAGKTLKTTEEEIAEATAGKTGDDLAGIEVEKPEGAETKDEVVEEKADEEAKKEDADEKTDEVTEEKSDEVVEEGADAADDTKVEDEKEVTEEVKEEVSEEAKDEVEEPVEVKETEEEVKEEAKEAGDMETRMNKLEDSMNKMLEILTKADELKEEAEAEEADEAEEKSEEAEVEAEEEVAEEEEAEKAEKSEITKLDVQKSDLINKLEGQLDVATKEVERLKKATKPSKLVSPLAIAKGFEWVKEPTKEVESIDARLADINKIREEKPGLYTQDVQAEAFRLVKIKKDILYQMS